MFKDLFNIKRSLKAKFFISFALLLFVSISVLTWFWSRQIITTSSENAANYVIDATRNVTVNFDETLSQINDFAIKIASEELIVSSVASGLNSDNKADINDYLNILLHYNKNLTYGIVIADFKGSSCGIGSSYLPQNFLELDWVKKIIDANGNPVAIIRNQYSEKAESDLEKPYFITIGCTIRDGDIPQGIIIIDVKSSIIYKSFNQRMMNGVANSMILNGDNSLLFCTNYLLERQLTPDTIIRSVEMMGDASNKFSAFNQTIHNVPYFAIGYKSASSNLTIIKFIPKVYINRSYVAALKQTTAGAVVCLFLALLISMLLAKSITKKINKLKVCMSSYNELSERRLEGFKQKSGGDEIDESFTIFSEMIETIRKQIEDIEALNEQKRVYEIKALEEQINPHFIYNTLNTIKYLADIQGAKNINSVTVALIKLLRFSVSNTQKFITIREEIEYIKNYVEIQKYRYSNDIGVTYEISDEILDCKMLKMILQPIVENAFKHGLHNTENGSIIIKGQILDSNLEFKIIDNGIGMTQEKIDSILNNSTNLGPLERGIGIANINNRLKLFFGDEYGLHIFSVKDLQTIITVKIPITERDDNNVC